MCSFVPYSRVNLLIDFLFLEFTEIISEKRYKVLIPHVTTLEHSLCYKNINDNYKKGPCVSLQTVMKFKNYRIIAVADYRVIIC